MGKRKAGSRQPASRLPEPAKPNKFRTAGGLRRGLELGFYGMVYRSFGIIQRLLGERDKLKLFELHPSDMRSLATGINERGDIVGISDTADGRVRPFVARVVREPAPPTPSSSTTGLPATTVPVAPTSATSTPARPSSAAPRFTG